MRLLVTRPQPDAERTARALAALGHEVLVQPLLTIAFNPPPIEMAQPAAILVTSQNAVRALARWPQAAGWMATPVYAAGSATALALAELGFADVRAGARDVESLADAVLATFRKHAGPLLYPTARDRAGALAGGLAGKGYDVRTIEAYRADPVARLDPAVRRALAENTVDGILLYSGRTAKALLAVAGAEGISTHLGRPHYFVISDHVADIVRNLGAAIHVAERPDEDSLLALIPAAA
jgi:uroporphyrinogen-III synthase